MIFGTFGILPTPDYLKNGYGGLTGSQGGLIGMVSNIVKLLIVIGGLVAFINILLAGFTYITSGDKADELVKAHQRLYMSLVGLLVMVGSYAIAALVGLLLFGDAGFILKPVIYGPGN